MNESTNQFLKLCGKASAGMTLLSGASWMITDILAPLGPFTAILFILSVFTTLAMLAAKLFGLDKPIKVRLKDYWFIPSFFAGFFATILLLFGYQSSRQFAHEGGALAAYIPVISALQQDLGLVRESIDRIDKNVGLIKKETTKGNEIMRQVRDGETSDPAVRLKNLGIDFTPYNFLEFVELGKLDRLELFLKARMPIETGHNEGRTIDIMLARNKTNPGDTLRLLMQYGFDPDHVFESEQTFGPKKRKLIMWAIEVKNSKLINALISAGADLDTPIEYAAEMMTTVTGPPLLMSVERDHYDIAVQLAEGGADTTALDHAAYRIAYFKARRLKLEGKSISEVQQQALERLKPESEKKVREIHDFIDISVSRTLLQQQAETLRKEIYNKNLEFLALDIKKSDANVDERYSLALELDKLDQDLAKLEAKIATISNQQ